MLRYVSFLFISSFLLFLIQPMLAKSLLPLVGGAPSIWIVCMLFFQLLLLAGYGYAALSSAYLSIRRQIALHALILVAAALLMLPVTLTDRFIGEAHAPEVRVLLSLLFSIGLPYFLLASHSSLLQRWYHVECKRSPYYLFATSNVASLLGLFGYPFLVEWLLPLPEQLMLWSAGFGTLMMLFILLILPLYRTQADASNRAPLGQNLPWKQAGFIVFLGFVPSSLFISTTLFITTDIASFPLLWVVPLALYLLSFIVAFSARGERAISIAQQCHVVAVSFTLAATFLLGITWLMALHLAFLFIIATSCHGRVSQLKPEPNRLTAFYFWLSVGGALGGLFNLMMPYIFNGVYEYRLVLLLSVLALSRSQLLHFALPKKLVFGIVIAVAVMIIGLFLKYQSTQTFHTIYQSRNFFGVSKVERDDRMTRFVHGTTNHGFQPIKQKDKLRTTSYYGPLRLMLNDLPDSFYDKPFGVLGLGTGTLSCLGRKDQQLDFFEIDQAVIDIAQNDDLFTYIRDCSPDIAIIKGDGRLQLAHKPEHFYHLLVMDAFTSDAVPMHLLTKEAVGLYIDKLDPVQGILAFNISNRHLDFSGVLAHIAHEYGWYGYLLHWKDSPTDPYDFESVWFVMLPPSSPWKSELKQLGFTREKPDNQSPLWTDDYSNILPVFIWH